jgi:hypothetical protein
MAKQLFGNNASSLLAASISDTDLSIQVQTGFGASFPTPGTDEYFLVTLENTEGDIEVVKVDDRVGDLLNIPVGGRGQEGTSAQSWTNGQARVELRLTKGTMEVFLQRGGDAMEGDLNMDGNEIQDALLTGTGTKIMGGEIVAVPIRGSSGDSSNEIAVPNDGTRALAGGVKILTEGDTEFVSTAAFKPGMIIEWFGLAVNCPDGWAICDGTNGTPDMRNLFSVGAGDDYALNATGGAATASGNTGNAGGHAHGGETGGTALTADQGPLHHHRLYGVTGTFHSDLQDGFGNPNTAVIGEQNGSNAYIDQNASGTQLIEDSGGAGDPHDHTIAAVGDHNHSIGVSTLPPYRALYKIMFIGF